MNRLVTVLLAVVLGVGAWAGALAQSSDPAKSGTSKNAETQVTPGDDRDASRDSASASPRTTEPQKILGMSASTAVFLAAVLFFVIVLFAAEVSRRSPSYRRTDIDPRT